MRFCKKLCVLKNIQPQQCQEILFFLNPFLLKKMPYHPSLPSLWPTTENPNIDSGLPWSEYFTLPFTSTLNPWAPLTITLNIRMVVTKRGLVTINSCFRLDVTVTMSHILSLVSHILWLQWPLLVMPFILAIFSKRKTRHFSHGHLFQVTYSTI